MSGSVRLRLPGIGFREPPPDLSAEDVCRRLPAGTGLYLHVPFCRTLCPFCPYNKVRYHEHVARAYVQDLVSEADAYLSVLSVPFSSLYVGGGTPTLCLEPLAPLLARLPVSGERAIEVLPLHLTAAGAERLASLGFGYVSLGVQSFDERILRRLRRPGTPAGNRAAVELAVRTFDCVDVDLIFDTAYDDPRILLDDLRTCFELGVGQVSTYPLMRFGFTPLGKGPHHGRREHAALRSATDLAAAHGYRRRSVWTFARPDSGTYSSITRPYYLGLGAGAASFTGDLFCVNHFGINQYGRAIRDSRLPVALMARLPRTAAALYRTFWQAYTGSLPTTSADPLLRHPASVSARRLTRALGWGRQVGDDIQLTQSGYDRYHDLERWVTYHLIEPLWEQLSAEHDLDPVHRMAAGA